MNQDKNRENKISWDNTSRVTPQKKEMRNTDKTVANLMKGKVNTFKNQKCEKE